MGVCVNEIILDSNPPYYTQTLSCIGGEHLAETVTYKARENMKYKMIACS